MFALRRAAIKAAPLAARSTVRPFSVLGARFCKYQTTQHVDRRHVSFFLRRNRCGETKTCRATTAWD